LIFTLPTPSQADDIRDFQIEGMSIGDSALDYFSKQEIKKAHKYKFKNDEFSTMEFKKLNFFETYDNIQISFKTNDQKLELHAVEGLIFYEKNIKKCIKKIDEVDKEISEIFKKIKKKKKKTYKHPYDKSGDSTITDIRYNFSNGDSAQIACYNWSKKINYTDNFRIILRSKKFSNFLRTKAHK